MNDELIARLRTRFKNTGRMLDKEAADALEAAQPDDLDYAKAVVRSSGYSLVSQRFIVLFAEFIQDWRKGDFELPTLAALDMRSCFDAWQEEVNQAEVRQVAQPVGEPVAWLWEHVLPDGSLIDKGLSTAKVTPADNAYWGGPRVTTRVTELVARAAAPQVPMTEDEVEKAIGESVGHGDGFLFCRFVRAIEAHHKIGVKP